MKRILLVFTGGTIGSTVTNGTIDINAATGFKLLDLLKANYPRYQEFDFHCIRPVDLLSENLLPQVWESIITAIAAQTLGGYDGVIVTHGTDTLSYTAAAMGFYWHALGLPLLLVSSDYPLDDARANGLDNFIGALEFVRQVGEAGVFVPYRNKGQMMQVHMGIRLASSLQLSGDFISVQHKSYMQFDGQSFTVLNPRIYTEKPPQFQLSAKFSAGVLMVRPYPGLNYQYIDLSQVDVVLHDLYHSGTAAVSMQWGENYCLPAFIERCKRQAIKVYLAPAINSGAAYQSTKALIAQGARMIWNMSIEAAYVKLLLAYGNFTDEQTILDFIETDIAGEHV